MFKGIRNKFLFAFVLGIAATLVTAFIVSYNSIDSVYMRINEHSTNAELTQISNNMKTMFSEMETMLLTQVINSEVADELARYHRLSQLEMTYAIQDISREIQKMISAFSYMDSVYIYIGGERFLGVSKNNIMQYRNPEIDWPSRKILKFIDSADVTMRAVGDVRPEDFPLEMSESAYLMFYRKRSGMLFCVNIKESALVEMYSGFEESGTRAIRILDSEGMIVSSTVKSEIGTIFDVLEGESLTAKGTVNKEGIVTTYMPVDYGFVISSSIPTSIYTRELTVIRNRLLLVFSLGMVIIAVFFYYWIEHKLRPIKSLQKGMQNAGRGDYSGYLTPVGNDELSDLAENYNMMLTNLQNLTENRRQIESELRERELVVLRNEINPHFLYNTLNTIKCMADIEGNQEVARSIVALGGIIAPLYKEKRPTWTFMEELKLISKYLEIMNIRYGNGIRYEEHISDDLLEYQIMRFILQPIIENSILHGFQNRGYAGKIVLTVEMDSGDVLITVEDDGQGVKAEELAEYNASLKQGSKCSGVGMANVYRRIALRYGEGYGMELKASRLGGLCTLIRVPQIKMQQKI